MNLNKWLGFVTIFLGGPWIFCSCIESPFSSNISPEPSVIRGQVNLLDDYDDGDAYVWLEGFNIGTRTDEGGNFELKIPKALSEMSGSALNGIFKLYFYVANYDIITANVGIRNGMFIYGQGDIDPDGNLCRIINMKKILSIYTIVEPDRVSGNYDGPINVQVTLQTTDESVMVIYPKSTGEMLGAILLKNDDTQEVYVDIPDPSAKSHAQDIIGTAPKSRRMVFQINGTNFRDLYLPVGDYTVIPYFIIKHDNLPQQLLITIGPNVEKIGKNFLKIPCRREGGRFRVID